MRIGGHLHIAKGSVRCKAEDTAEERAMRVGGICNHWASNRSKVPCCQYASDERCVWVRGAIIGHLTDQKSPAVSTPRIFLTVYQYKVGRIHKSSYIIKDNLSTN